MNRWAGWPFPTVTRIRRAVAYDPMSDEDTLSDWESATEAPIPDALFSPGTSAEFPNVDIDALAGLATLYVLAADVDITSADRVRVDGAVWSVEGRPGRYRGAGGVEGTVINLALHREENP